MKISSDLIPHNKFHKGEWYRSQSQWYYFNQCEQEYKLPTSKVFYEGIDTQLLPIVKYLHSKNIPTTPSCEGHFYNRKYYKKLYTKLCKDSELIKTVGIILENDKYTHLYVDQNYTIPWTESEFLQQVSTYQTNGVLGFVDNYSKYYNILRKQQIENIKISHDDPVTLIQVKSTNNTEMCTNWNAIKSLIYSIVENSEKETTKKDN